MSSTTPSMLRQTVRPWIRMPSCQHHLCRQASTSSYYPQQQQQHDVEPLPAPPKPPAATWYTGRPALNSFLDTLQSTVKSTRSTLYHQGYLSSVSQDVRTLSNKDSRQSTTTGARWLDAESMASKIGTGKIRLAYYRQITSLLSELQALLPLLQQEGQGEELAKLLKEHARPDLNAAAISLLSEEAAAELALAKASPAVGGRENNRGYGYLSRKTGISFAIGRKKTASARAWILPLPVTPAASQAKATESSATEEGKAAPIQVETEAEPALGQILINSRPISKYFSDAAARSLILRPFSLTENLGKYNVFVLTSGGGPSSQAQATAVACARALAARDLSEEQVTRQILSKADMLRRDPRVVERKKTGKPKARKSFTWVKR